MDLDEALELIEEGLGLEIRAYIEDGLPGGSNDECRYDSTLVKDMARIVQKWMNRVGR
jgi:predicted RNase H-like HicB family nuclease